VVTIILLATVLSGCDLSVERSIAVTIPAVPRAYGEEDIVWTVRWWDGVALREVEVAVPANALPEGRSPDASSLSLPLASSGAEVVVVTAVATVEPGIRLMPYGGWVRAPGDSVTPTRELGVAAGVLLQLAAAGIDPALINVERLAEEVTEECGDDPATLDRERLVEALGTLEMRRYAIRRRERRECEISLPGDVPLDWISDDPSHPVIEGVVAAGRCYWLVPVAEGEVRYLRRPAAPSGWEVLTVGRDATGHAYWYLRRVTAPRS
jgi:hypothetical protein